MDKQQILLFFRRFASKTMGKISGLGKALYFLGEVITLIMKGKIRLGEVAWGLASSALHDEAESGGSKGARITRNPANIRFGLVSHK